MAKRLSLTTILYIETVTIILQALLGVLEMNNGVFNTILNFIAIIPLGQYIILHRELALNKDSKRVKTMVLLVLLFMEKTLTDFIADNTISFNIFLNAILIYFSLNRMERISYDKALKVLRVYLGLFVYVSTVLFFTGNGYAHNELALEYGLEDTYSGIFSFINYRFMGLASHSIVLGFISAIYIIVILEDHYDRVPLKILKMICPVFMLVVSQGKTALVCLAVALLISVFNKMNVLKDSIVYKCIVLLLVAVIFVSTLVSEIDWTFTGRVSIWTYSLYMWKSAPVLGVGSNYLSNWVGQAHNQFIQSLVANGIIGLIILCLFFASLFSWCYDYWKKGYKVPFLVGIMLFVQCFSETPITGMAIDMRGIVIIMMFALLYSAESEEVMYGNC